MLGLWLGLRGIIAFIPAFIWKWLAIGLIAVVIFYAGDVRGRRIEHAKNQAAIEAAQAAANRQDQQAQTDVNTQDAEVTKQLMEQKKVDDAAIEDLQRRLAAAKQDADRANQQAYNAASKSGSKPAACPPVNSCLYDKSNADPDVAGSSSGRVRNDPNRRPGAGDKKPARPAVVPPAGGSSSGKSGKLPVRGVGTAQAGNR
jgi:hypothetical protein